MTIYVGSARQDENNGGYGGIAGDQTKGEVATQKYYVHPLGWRVFRAKDSSKRNKIAWAMQAACDNNNIGYDMYQRNDLWNYVKDKDFNPWNCDVPKECDCSALVRVCCAYAGIYINTAFTTYYEPTVLLNTGEFIEVTGQSLANGDILCTPTTGHTVIVTSGGLDLGTTEKDDDMNQVQSDQLHAIYTMLTRKDNAGYSNIPTGHNAYGRLCRIEQQLERQDNAGHDTQSGHDLFGRVNALQEQMNDMQAQLMEISKAIAKLSK